MPFSTVLLIRITLLDSADPGTGDRGAGTWRRAPGAPTGAARAEFGSTSLTGVEGSTSWPSRGSPPDPELAHNVH